MSGAEIGALPERIAEGMLRAWSRRKRFEAQLLAVQVWSVLKKPGGGGEQATDAELGDFMEVG